MFDIQRLIVFHDVSFYNCNGYLQSFPYPEKSNTGYKDRLIFWAIFLVFHNIFLDETTGNEECILGKQMFLYILDF